MPSLTRVAACAIQAWGYPNIEAYYDDINGLNWIPQIQTPTLFLSAKDDPFLGSGPSCCSLCCACHAACRVTTDEDTVLLAMPMLAQHDSMRQRIHGMVSSMQPPNMQSPRSCSRHGSNGFPSAFAVIVLEGGSQH